MLKNIIYNKPIIFIVVLPLLMMLVYFGLMYHKPYDIVSQQSIHAFNTSVFATRHHSNTSEVNPDSFSITTFNANKFEYTYNVSSGVNYPRYGMLIYPKSNVLMNFSKYDFIKIRIKAKQGKRIWMHLGAHIKGHTQTLVWPTYRYFSSVLNLGPAYKTIVIPLKSLKTPRWWFYDNKIEEHTFKQTDLSKIAYICFSNCMELNLDGRKRQTDTIEIDTIGFYVDTWRLFRNAAIILVIYFVCYFFIRLYLSSHKVAQLQIHYKKTEVEDVANKEEQVLLDYLAQHFHVQNLTLSDVQYAIQVNERRIAAIIKSKFDQNFKQYLNQLRITEAKTLLSNTNSSIAEIAFLVGYGNTSHFNRVFKMYENISPNEFRKKS
jgi:AraC-like DNA-binding protein